jgi:RNA polymerase subunit RPABC4/transcription elongation factor Spt4
MPCRTCHTINGGDIILCPRCSPDKPTHLWHLIEATYIRNEAPR